MPCNLGLPTWFGGPAHGNEKEAQKHACSKAHAVHEINNMSYVFCHLLMGA